MPRGKIVAQNFRMARKQRKLSQQAVAKKARMSVSYVSMLERDQRTPPLITLDAIAKAVDVSPLYLLQELSTEDLAGGSAAGGYPHQAHRRGPHV
jgi:transcriptional regulator with XRE-family HTH domain